ncbi:ABC transporter substrate-binding protein [Jidongwangia harbinensis]|uniref:ABC transporter substrate-binding protein n=1 Tax=Jidongwangia harbinensis TaxID=2878561 RepID=UPI001CD919E6|nr:ABC transporter substrate-binding protein [Jidongwangia harbinensis]MCA2211805.1 ABC transporter substrate-binding protein [Jidongwangia harbinensis]
MTARRLAAAATAVLTLAAGACGSAEPTSTATETRQLEVVSWWTSGSEAAALETLLAAFRRTAPDAEVVNGAVTGGAGSQAVVELARRLQNGDPPDVWQTFNGKSVQGYAERGAVRDLTSVFDGRNLRATMHPTVLASLQRDGKPYGVPTGAHRSNVLWFNTEVLRRAGVTPPAAGYPLATFLADLAKVKASGATALCLGGRDPFTTVELFENILLGSLGTDGWQRMVADELDWRGRPVDTALATFGTVLTYADPEAGGQTWDAAAKRLATGGCGYLSMNDSVYGELIAGGATEGTGFGAVPFPGTQDGFLAVVDVFVAATRAGNARNALTFLGDIGDPATQLAFNQAKGSVPVWRNVDVSTLPPYQRNASASFWASPVLLSVAHGEAMSPRFQEGFYDAVATYVRTRDPDAFADNLVEAVSREKIPPR